MEGFLCSMVGILSGDIGMVRIEISLHTPPLAFSYWLDQSMFRSHSCHVCPCHRRRTHGYVGLLVQIIPSESC